MNYITSADGYLRIFGLHILYKRTKIGRASYLFPYKTEDIERKRDSWDEILGHHFDKTLKSSAPFYSQFLLLANFTENYAPLKKFMQKNPLNKKTRVYSWIAFCSTEKRGQITRQKLKFENTQVYAQKPRLNMLFKNSIPFFYLYDGFGN